MALYNHLTASHIASLKSALDAANVNWRDTSPDNAAARHLRLQAHDHTGRLWEITPLTAPNVPATTPKAIWAAHCPQTGAATAALTISALTNHLRPTNTHVQGELL